MANTFKKVIDRLTWVQVAPSPAGHSAGASLTSDLRSDVSRNPFVYSLVSSTVVNRFNIITKAWGLAFNPGLAGTVAAGAAIAFAPSFGVVGVIAAGATPSSVILSTALPTAVGVNILANRGGSGEYGFKIRIIDTVAGKTEERYIIANTSGTTPTIHLLSPLTFTPATGARYEIVAGRVFMLNAGTLTTNSFRSFEVSTNTLSGSLTTTNLSAGTIATDTDILVLDEQYTPYDSNPGEGLVRGQYIYDTGVVSRVALAATGAGASTLTGQATLGDSGVGLNEYRNFQIRIVEDLVNKTAVGQRRIIASNTAGPSPVYTLGTAWAVQPSTSAKYVIELPNLMLVRTSGQTPVYTYNYSDAAINNGTNTIAAGSWSATYFANAPAANAASGVWAPSWGIRPTAAKTATHGMCHFFRGGTATTLDVLNISGSITGTWETNAVYDGPVAWTTGTTGGYAPCDNEGRMFYLNIFVSAQINQIYRFDVQNRVLSPFAATDFIQGGTAVVGKRIACYAAIDGTDTYDVVLLQAHTSGICQEMVVLI